ncbi:hypothetical protein [Coxiella-like endosymbiont]|uniref:hypothetical protein n=1 Tax=Coxiella-like endosymbiont TaxID=1592897 RepID=UPI00272B7AD6|nr:hypothetical protein [Coxiella-like endosymbiont]
MIKNILLVAAESHTSFVPAFKKKYYNILREIQPGGNQNRANKEYINNHIEAFLFDDGTVIFLVGINPKYLDLMH